MSPLTPLTNNVAVPAAIGAASPVCTRPGIVMNPSVAEANTHGASGIAQLNARAVPCPAGVDGSQTCSVARAVAPVRPATTTATAIAATPMAAAIPNDNRMPAGPAPAINAPANGPIAKPAINTAPAAAAPAGPLRSEAHAVHELMDSPTPSPTTSRPSSRTSYCCEHSMARVPTTAVADPASATDRRPNASEARPPTSRPGSSPSA
jgi:uncharacterized membrane-anchored protein